MVDPWHPLGVLFDKFGPWVMFDSGLGKNAKVSAIVHGDGWRWPRAGRSLEMGLIKDINFLPSPLESDSYIWNLSSNGMFSVKSAWNFLREEGTKVSWGDVIWFPCNIPRMSFISWLAILGRLSTQDRLMSFGTASCNRCLLCKRDLESIDHLFFSCDFSEYLVWPL